MKRATGKSNISIIRDYVNGVRPFTTVGYTPDINIASRKNGEIWEDQSGKKWVKKNGYKQAVSTKPFLNIEQRCSICNADMKWGNRLDQKIYPKTNRCYECNILFEAQLRLKGLFGEYEKFKVVNNELSAAEEFKSKVESGLEYLKTYSGKAQFFNDDGSEEVWLDNTDARDVLKKEMETDLAKINERIEEAKRVLSETKYDMSIEKRFVELTKTKL